jgi:hypothetical protein
MAQISRHTAYLGRRLYEGMSSLRHANNKPLCQVYKEDYIDYTDSTTQGGTIAFNVMNADGSYIGYADVERMADKRSIYIRAGGLCNPGGIATYLGLAPWQMKRSYSAGHRCGDDTAILNGKPTGVVRASLGAMCTIADVDNFLTFLKDVFMENDATQTAMIPLSMVKQPQLYLSDFAGKAQKPTPIMVAPLSITKSPQFDLDVFADKGSKQMTVAPLNALIPPEYVLESFTDEVTKPASLSAIKPSNGHWEPLPAVQVKHTRNLHVVLLELFTLLTQTTFSWVGSAIWFISILVFSLSPGTSTSKGQNFHDYLPKLSNSGGHEREGSIDASLVAALCRTGQGDRSSFCGTNV